MGIIHFSISWTSNAHKYHHKKMKKIVFIAFIIALILSAAMNWPRRFSAPIISTGGYIQADTLKSQVTVADDSIQVSGYWFDGLSLLSGGGSSGSMSDTLAILYLTDQLKFINGGYFKRGGSAVVEISPNGASGMTFVANSAPYGLTMNNVNTITFPSNSSYQYPFRGFSNDTVQGYYSDSTWALSARAVRQLIAANGGSVAVTPPLAISAGNIRIDGYGTTNYTVGIQAATNQSYIYFSKHAVLDRTYFTFGNMGTTVQLNETGLFTSSGYPDTSNWTDYHYVTRKWVQDRIPAGSGTGTVTTTGTPASGQLALFSGGTSITGDTTVTFNTTNKVLTVKGYTSFRDTVYFDWIGGKNVPITGRIYLNLSPTGGVDSGRTVNARVGLIWALPDIREQLSDLQNGEMKWWHYDWKKKEWVYTYGVVNSDPIATDEAHTVAIEFAFRYIAKQDSMISVLEDRVTRLEGKGNCSERMSDGATITLLIVILIVFGFITYFKWREGRK